MEKIALIIGHNEKQPGAWNNITGAEFTYWKEIALAIKGLLPMEVDVYERKYTKGYGYGAEMATVVNELNKQDYKLCIELHYNSSSSQQSNGAEVLVYKGNPKAKAWSNKFLDMINEKFQIRSRGLIEIADMHRNGAYGIIKAKHTYILTEPYFGSNPDEALKFSIKHDVINLYVEFIKYVLNDKTDYTSPKSN